MLLLPARACCALLVPRPHFFTPLPAGAAIFKGLQRLAGTLLAGALGVGSQYLVYLVNGLSYDNTALKFAAMTVILALLAGLLAAASIKFPKYSCEWAGQLDPRTVGRAVGGLAGQQHMGTWHAGRVLCLHQRTM